MKKILFIFPLLIAGLLFNGCDKDEDETPAAVTGCMDSTACNYNAAATESDDSCIFANTGFDCDGNVVCNGNMMYVGGDSYDWGDGTMEFVDYGYFDTADYDVEDSGYSFDMRLFSEDLMSVGDYYYYLDGYGHYMNISIYGDFEDGIDGTYQFSENFGVTGTWDSEYSYYAVDVDGADLVSGYWDPVYFEGGEIEIYWDDETATYDVTIDAIDSNGHVVSGCYNGTYIISQYDYARSNNEGMPTLEERQQKHKK